MNGVTLGVHLAAPPMDRGFGVELVQVAFDALFEVLFGIDADSP